MKETKSRSLFAIVTGLVIFSCIFAVDLNAQIQMQRVTGGLSRPVLITHARDSRLFIVEQAGLVRIFYGGSLLPTPFLNISGISSSSNEQGLLGIAFHPNYPATPYVFVHFTSNGNVLPDGTIPVAGENFIVRYAVSSDPNIVDSNSGKVMLRIAQQFTNHNGGMIEFGPDGYLHISKGDGGSGNDPFGNAQNINVLLGKMLRIDVNQNVNVSPYHGIPSTNPFASTTGRDEVFLTGLRNPWRFSFDSLTGEMWIGDVGQGSREEINRLPMNSSAPGKNFGWRIFEGTSCTGLDPCVQPANYVPPVTEYSSAPPSSRCSITGGYVYRGSKTPELFGRYIYGDFCTGELFSFFNGNFSVLLDTNQMISSFGESSSGELYVAGHSSGEIYKVLPFSAPPALISGRVTNSNGHGIAGARIIRQSVSSGQIESVTTNQFGYYRFAENELNQEFIITAKRKGMSLAPTERRFTLTDDFYGIDFANGN